MRRAVALILGLAACAHATSRPSNSAGPPGTGADSDWPPLLDAAARGDLDRVRRLLDEGADIAARRPDGTTALHWAVFADSPSEIHDYSEGLGHPHDTYWTPKRDAPMVDLLIVHRAAIDAADARGETSLHRAVISAALPAARALMAAGADPMQRDRKGRTPLDVVRERAVHPDNWTPYLPEERQEILRLLERAAASPK